MRKCIDDNSINFDDQFFRVPGIDEVKLKIKLDFLMWCEVREGSSQGFSFSVMCCERLESSVDIKTSTVGDYSTGVNISKFPVLIKVRQDKSFLIPEFTQYSVRFCRFLESRITILSHRIQSCIKWTGIRCLTIESILLIGERYE